MDVDAIPNEVWILIFSLLSKPDLKALRLTGSHNLESLASSLLFTTAYIAARRGVLNTFIALTTHPNFSKYVKEVIYDSSYISRDVVEQHENEKGGSALTTMFNQQESIHAGELAKSLDKAFKCLSNIKSVHYADMSRVAYLPGDRDDISCDHKDYQDGPLIHRIGSTCSKPNQEVYNITPAINGKRHKANFQTNTEVRGFIALMQALANRTACGMSQLSLGHTLHATRSAGVSYWVFLGNNTKITQLLLHPSISSLRKLDITISSDWPAESGHQRWVTIQEQSGKADTTASHESFDSLDQATLLHSAQNLQEVKLAGQCPSYSLSLANAFSSHTWTRLRNVNLLYFKGSSQDLEDFVKRHRSSLKYMSINRFNLTSGTWKALGAVLPAVAPKLDLIFGLVFLRGLIYPVEQIFPLTGQDFDESGLKINHSRRRRSGEDEDEGEDEDLNGLEDRESEFDPESDRLSYSSDDSTPSTASNPRRKPDRSPVYLEA